MGNASFWVVEAMLCILLGLLVWRTQHALKSLFLLVSERHWSPPVVPVLPHVLLLLVLWILTFLVATGVFLAAALSLSGWQQTWSVSTLRRLVGAGGVTTVVLVFGCAALTHRRRVSLGARRTGVDIPYRKKEKQG